MMKTTFDKSVRNELLARIDRLNESSQPLWGKMTIYQMLKHCTMWEEMISGKKAYRQVFLGRLFGKVALRNMIGDDRPLKKNVPTVASFRVTGTGDVAAEKEKWIALLQAHESFPVDEIVHPFFGIVTKEQIGLLAYKHTDHHLRQFNC